MRRGGGLVAVFAAVVAAIVGGALAAQKRSTPPRLTVFAAASLTDVFPKIDSRERYSFGGSNALATQVEQGLPADVFASANTKLPWQLHRKHLVTRPVEFTANKLCIIVAKGNPLRVRANRSLERHGLRIVMAAAGVPAGDYTRKVLARLGLSDLVGKAVSQETDVREVLSKVVLGEADVGFVYGTDAKAVAGQVGVVGIPKLAQPTVVYAAAAVEASSHVKEAKAWIRHLLGRKAQHRLRQAGFRPVPR